MKPYQNLIGKNGDALSGGFYRWIWTTSPDNPYRNLPWANSFMTDFPFGDSNFFVGVSVSQYFIQIPMWLLGQVIPASLVHNLFILIFIAFNYITMYILLKFLSENNFQNQILANGFTFSSYFLMKMSYHPIYLNVWIFNLIILFILNIKTKTLDKNFLYAILALGTCLYIDGYYFLISLPFILTLLTKILATKQNKLKKLITFFGIYLPFFIPLIYFGNKFLSSEINPIRTQSDFSGFSGKITNLFQYSSENIYLVVINQFLPFLKKSSFTETESIFWNNWIVVFVVIFFYILFKNRRHDEKYVNSQEIFLYLILICFFTFLFFIKFSFFNIEIPNLSQIIFYNYPIWRVSSRGMVIFLILTPLFLQLLLKNMRINKLPIVNFFLLFSLILDLGITNNWQVKFTTLPNEKSIYHRLNQITKKSDIVFDATLPDLTNQYLINQTIYKRRIVNSRVNPFDAVTSNAYSLGDSNSICLLNTLGVKYIILPKYEWFNKIPDKTQIVLESNEDKTLVLKIKSNCHANYWVSKKFGFWNTEYRFNSGFWSSNMNSQLQIRKVLSNTPSNNTLKLLFDLTSISPGKLEIVVDKRIKYQFFVSQKFQRQTISVSHNSIVDFYFTNLIKISEKIPDSSDNRVVGFFLGNIAVN